MAVRGVPSKVTPASGRAVSGVSIPKGSDPARGATGTAGEAAVLVASHFGRGIPPVTISPDDMAARKLPLLTRPT